MPNSVIDKGDNFSKTMSLALREVGRKQRASGLERLIMRISNNELKNSKQQQTKANLNSIKLASKSFLVLLALTCLNVGCFGINKVASSSSPTNIEQSFTDSNKLLLFSHHQEQQQQQQQQQPKSQQQQTPQNHLHNQTPVSSFDASNYRNVYEAIQNHPELKDFANLCESDAVKGIVSMDKIALTVFAPIDRSLSDLVSKSKSHSINLIELAQHHIAQGFVMPDENTKYPRQFNSYSLLSPLYLNQLVQNSNKQATYFVNNAKILATYLFPIENGAPDTYQTLHVIDQVIEFAYVNRQTQLRSPSTSNAQSMSAKRTTATLKRAFNLDEFVAQPEAGYEFYERFFDYQTNQPQIDLYHTQVFKGSQQAAQKVSLTRKDFNLASLIKLIKQQHFQQLRGKLFQVNESSSLNTYFLPINSEDLDALLESPAAQNSLTFESLIIPNQVLFTRTMLLGSHYDTLLNRDSNTHRVTLNLAKNLPIDKRLDSSETTATLYDESMSQNSVLDQNSIANSHNLLATPLLLQSKCLPTNQLSSSQERSTTTTATPATYWRPGVTSTEILVANIPLTNGVLHLIKKPIMVSDRTNILDYLNDNDNQLSNVVNSIGSSTGSSLGTSSSSRVKVNKFRELLAKERQMLATFSMDQSMNKTIFAPSDEAFSKLRYDLRALVLGDESLIPKHWDASYRHDLLERLVKRHIVLHQTITSDQMDSTTNIVNNNGLQQQQQQQQVLTENGKILTFSRTIEPSNDNNKLDYLQETNNFEKFHVESDSTRANILHHDLIGSNGVLHIIDRVLGEEQETVYSLLKSIILKYNYSLEETQVNQNELNQMIQSNLKSSVNSKQSSVENGMISAGNSIQENSQTQTSENDQQSKANNNNPELAIISKSIGQYLDELSSSNRRQLDMLGSSVNISYQLAKLTSLAEGLDDWNERFKQEERSFTYFVPSDLAWIKLQQSQPELYKPLMYFLDSQSQQSSEQQRDDLQKSGQLYFDSSAPQETVAKSPRYSESSHRLRKILERHLVANKKIDKRDLNRMDTIQTLGATLRLVEAPHQYPTQHQLTASALDMQPTGAFAALHSIVTGSNNNHNNNLDQIKNQPAKLPLKSLKLDSANANIVQVNEASNGFVYIIDNVLLLPNDADYIVQTSASPAISSTVSSFLGGHNSAILDFLNNLLTPNSSNPLNLSANSMLALIGTLFLAISVLLVLAIVLVIRKRQQNKMNRHQQLESGLTSSSSANSGSTSTTKSL